MRIVHTCLRYPPAVGGVETYVHKLVERTRDIAAGRDVRVLTSSMRTHGPITMLPPDDLLDDPPYVQRIHVSRTPLISYPRLQALSYYLGHHQPDIVHGYSYWYQPADVAARYATKHHLPFIFHPMYYPRSKPQWRLYEYVRGQATFAAANAVVVISPYEQEQIEQAGYSVKRFVLIPPGVDAATLQQPHPNPFASRNIPGKIILTVSRLSSGKGLHEAIQVLPDVLKAIPEASLVIMGEDFGAKTQLEHQVAQLGLTARVRFWGKATTAELLGGYQHASVLLHPSHYEAFGIAPAESLAAGTPVVARDVAALPYVVSHAHDGLLFKNNTELVQHLITLLTNDSLRERFGQHGRQRIAQEFTWEKSCSTLLRLYDELITAK